PRLPTRARAIRDARKASPHRRAARNETLRSAARRAGIRVPVRAPLRTRATQPRRTPLSTARDEGMLAIARPRPPLLHRPLRADRRVTLTYFTERKQRPSPHARLSRPAVPRETTHVRSKGRA